MKAKSLSGDLLKFANDTVKRAWKDYQKPKNCTVTREMSGTQLTRLTARVFKRDGMVLFRKHPGFNNPHGFALEAIEIDRLDHNWNKPTEWNGNRIKFGIERDTFGAPVAYHILTRHPGDVFAYSSSPRYRERVPASEIIAVWDYERAEQTIGHPDTCAAGTALHHLEEYLLSEVWAARQGADMGGFFQKKSAANAEAGYGGEVDEDGAAIQRNDPGSWTELPMDWEAKQLAPQHPTTAFPSFIKSIIRLVSNALGISYNAAAGDYESINYSSWKAAFNEDKDEYQWLQSLLIDNLMVPWFEEWLFYSILSGKIQLPMTMFESLKAGAIWVPRVWQSVEPLKEMQASELAMRMGVESRLGVIRDDGGDIEDIDIERRVSKESAEANGLNPEIEEEPATAKQSSNSEEPTPPQKTA